ncbi:MAG: pirin family protein [Bacteroidetes bacterium]|nr:pirin family protein [Bacteroidota bacterium]
METVFHKASQRGNANHGWLKATHSFSFANYYDSEKMHFGKLRVLNDDEIAPSRGFDLHPHQNMEIITIPLSGSVRHIDSMGNEEIISSNEVQVMSAGSGIWHSEFNASDSEKLKLFQIWIFTDKKGYKPRYEQKAFSETERINKWQMLVSPKGKNDLLWIHQNAFISIINTNEIQVANYQLNKQGNGVYFMLIEGEAEINNQKLQNRDAVGVWSFYEPLEIRFTTNSKLLAIEVPMR